ncbi:MAG: hypothetical protein IPK69_08515 [Phycisphaerales bacterium]|nr:MAG: hypothetical protein IPK69_08515 [Phycisphaerales bacterium]
MSAIHRNRGLKPIDTPIEVPGRVPTCKPDAATRIPSSFEIRWSIAPSAATHLWREGEASTPGLAAPTRVSLVCSVSVDPRSEHSGGLRRGTVHHALKVEGQAARDLGSADVVITPEPRGLVHADESRREDGTAGFACTLRLGDPSSGVVPDVLFARTPMLVACGLAGGRFDRPALGEVCFGEAGIQQWVS